jgi:Ca2+-binding EF-hand superfamily protein
MPFTDEQIRAAVVALFKKYDKDNSGYIERSEIDNLCNELGK